MRDLIKVMKSLSDPNRVRIVKLLEQKELCVCELQEALNLAQSTVSKHMKILEEAGLVEYRKKGSWIIYRLSEMQSSPYVQPLLSHLKNWINDDKSLEIMRKKLPAISRLPQYCDQTSINEPQEV